MSHQRVSRRTLLTYTAVAGTASCIPLVFPGSAWAQGDRGAAELFKAQLAALEERGPASATGQYSRNGWEMENVADDHGNIYLRPVPGTPLRGIQVRIGDVETVLVHLVRRFHYEVDQLRAGDVVGWRAPATVDRSLPESNLASGTAVRIRPGHYPPGTRGNFFPRQLVVLRDVLAEVDGVVRWGGDDRTVDESLFYLDVRPGDERLTTQVNRLRGWQDRPGKGAGAPVDVASSARRKAATTLERRQRRAAGG